MTALTCRQFFPDYTAQIFIINLIRSGADSADASLYEFTGVLLAEALEKL